MCQLWLKFSILSSAFVLSCCLAEEIDIPVAEDVYSDKLEDNPHIQAVILDGNDFAFDLYRNLLKGILAILYFPLMQCPQPLRWCLMEWRGLHRER